MSAVTLIRIDAKCNMARFYKLDVQPSLFGWSVVREWGRIGQAGRVCVELHDTRGTADQAMISKWAQKRKRGYQ